MWKCGSGLWSGIWLEDMEGNSAVMNYSHWVDLWRLTRVHEEPHKLHGFTKARQDCMGPRAGNDILCISHNEMMSMYPGVYLIYSLCYWVHRRSSSVSIRLHSVSIIPVSLFVPTSFPTRNWMVVVVVVVVVARNWFSHHDGLQVHL